MIEKNSKFLFPLFLAVALSWVPALQAQSDITTPSQFDLLRSQRNEIKVFIQALVSRQLANEVTLALTSNGFREGQIKAVLESPEFNAFTQKVSGHPEVEKKMDALLDRVLAPGALENAIEKNRKVLLDHQREEIALAVTELIKASPSKNQSKMEEKQKNSIWQRLWKRLTSDLYN